jgi:uncharacterized protein YigA (DUF484 family)
MPAAETTLAQVRANIAEIHRTLSALEYLASGTLQKRTKVCGHPRCRCATDPAARHGPYYEWGYLKAGKLRSRSLSSRQAELMRTAIANYRKAKKLLKAWEAQTVRLIELNTPE